MKTTEKIAPLIHKYRILSLDGKNLQSFMNIRKELACCGYELSVKVAQYKREYDAAYYMRKTRFYSFKLESLSQGTGKAETLAETQITALRKEEKDSESLYVGTKTILHQVNETLDSLKQDISILRTAIQENTK